MAIELKEIIDVKTASIKDVRDKIAELREEISRLRLANEDYREEAQKVNVLQDHLGKVMSASKRYTKDAEGSFNALNAELRRLKDAWKAAGTEAERAKIGAQVNEVKAKLNSMNESIGNFQHNVGNYSNSIIDAFNKMGLSIGGQGTKMQGVFAMLSGGVESVGNAFSSLWKTMINNPIGVVVAALGALVGAVSAVTKAINDNEESQQRMHAAMAAFAPMKNSFRLWLDEIGQSFVQFTEKVSDNVRWMRESIAAFKDWAGITQGGLQAMKEEQKAWDLLYQSENKVVEMRRKATVADAKGDAAVARLRAEAMETKDLTEKKEKLNKAIEIQTALNNMHIKTAQAEYDLLRAQAAATPNNTAMNDALAEAEANLYRVREQGSQALRGLNRELNRYENGLKTTKKAVKELKEEEASLEEVLASIDKAEAEEDERKSEETRKRYEDAKELEQQLADNRKTDIELENEAYEEKKALLEEFHLDTYELTKEHEERIAELEAEAARRNAEMMEKARADEDADNKKQEKRYEQLMKARETATKNMAKGTSSILKNLSTAMGENTKLGKGFAIAAATIDTIAAAVTGFRAGMNQWADAGPMAWMAPVQAALNATMALTAGFAEVQKIRSVDTSGNDNGGGAGGATALAMPNIEGLSSPMDYTRQVVTDTEQEEMNRDNRVYILESDIQESNTRVRVRENETTF